MKHIEYYERQKEELRTELINEKERYLQFIESAKKIKRLKTKDGNDFKILSKNFQAERIADGRIYIHSDCHEYSSDWITLEGTADEIEKKIADRLESYKKRIAQVETDLVNLDRNFELMISASEQMHKLINCETYMSSEKFYKMIDSIIRYGL